jgi:hypothetical protein
MLPCQAWTHFSFINVITSAQYEKTDPLGGGTSRISLRLESADPAREDLAASDSEALVNQLYLQRGSQLYDYNSLIYDMRKENC